MTRDEIRDWALANGFEAGDAPTRLACPYAGATVTLDFLARGIRVTVSAPQGSHRIGTFNPGPNVRVNEHGVIEGIGLSASFAAGFVSRHPEAAPPAWMGESYLRAIGMETRGDGPSR